MSVRITPYPDALAVYSALLQYPTQTNLSFAPRLGDPARKLTTVYRSVRLRTSDWAEWRRIRQGPGALSPRIQGKHVPSAHSSRG